MHCVVRLVILVGFICCSLASWPNPNFKHYGYWTYNDTDYNHFIGSANLIYLYDLNLTTDAHSKGFNVLFNLENVLYVGTSSGLALKPDYLAQWKTVAAQAAPLLQSGDLLGFFMGDELSWGGLPWSSLNLSISMVKQTFPKSIVYYNDAYTIFTDPSIHYPMVPPMLDWISIDMYPDSWVFGDVYTMFTQKLYPIMQSHQGVLYVPPMYATAEDNIKYCKDPVCENAMLAWNSQAFQWALTDSKFVGLFAWHWDTFTVQFLPGYEYGLSSLPTLFQLTTNFAKQVTKQNLTFTPTVSGAICGFDTNSNADVACSGSSPLNGGCPSGFSFQEWDIGHTGSGDLGFCGSISPSSALPLGTICGMNLMSGQIVTCGGYDPYKQGCPAGYTQSVWATNWGGGYFYFCAKASPVPDALGTICGMVTNEGSVGILCNGLNPTSACPTGYAPAAWDVPFGTDGLWSVCFKIVS